ncbi:hypothetical protein ACU4GD_16740 [Cupriavidus basilensis]
MDQVPGGSGFFRRKPGRPLRGPGTPVRGFHLVREGTQVVQCRPAGHLALAQRQYRRRRRRGQAGNFLRRPEGALPRLSRRSPRFRRPAAGGRAGSCAWERPGGRPRWVRR